MQDGPQLNVFATFAAFMEGIAREGFEMWRYQRNLNGRNEGLNVVMHLSHVGACTGRDHFSGWSLDWVNLALGYLPFLHRFYAPADARNAFVAVRDAAGSTAGISSRFRAITCLSRAAGNFRAPVECYRCLDAVHCSATVSRLARRRPDAWGAQLPGSRSRGSGSSQGDVRGCHCH